MIFNGFPSGIGPFCTQNGSFSRAGTLRKLLFGVAQAHMKAKDTSEAIETLDKTIGLAQAAGDMQDVHVTKGDLEVFSTVLKSLVKKVTVSFLHDDVLKFNILHSYIIRFGF